MRISWKGELNCLVSLVMLANSSQGIKHCIKGNLPKTNNTKDNQGKHCFQDLPRSTERMVQRVTKVRIVSKEIHQEKIGKQKAQLGI